MVALRRRERKRSRPLPLRAAALMAIALFGTGCASNQTTPMRVAGPPADDRYWRVEVEDDGLPAQLAPRLRPTIQDDPSEPWSPNYGKGSAKVAATTSETSPPPQPTPAAPAVESPRPVLPRPKPSARRPIPVAHAIADDEAEDIIRRAVAEHEMRRAD
jgi:hypothetical protein